MAKLRVILLIAALSVAYIGQTQAVVSVPIRASYYADKFEGRLMANGVPYHAAVISAASRHFPLGTVVRVTNILTKRSILVTITDTGPWVDKFNLDLSKSAFVALGFDLRDGWGWVAVTREK